MGLLSFLFGNRNEKINEFLEREAVIIDVRTIKEWNSGHIESAINIPLDELNGKIKDIKALDKPIITCCASGVRSGRAANTLKKHNIEGLNGGSWLRLKQKL